MADGENFKAWLRGFQEVPAVSTEASGEFSAQISFDEATIEYKLSYNNLQGTVTQGHIHFGQHGVNGGIVVFLCQTATNPDPTGLAPDCPQSGTVTGKITAANVTDRALAQGIVGSPTGATPEEFAEFIDALRAGVTYANVHTSGDPGKGFPGGEIRGQIRKSGEHSH
jgi:hypothetical protein